MRRQYHPHKTERGVLVWDVHRLVELSRELPVQDVPIEEIKELDQRSWFSETTTPPSCRDIAFHAKLIEETDLNHPIILGEDGRVMDGMHRVCKAWTNGHKTVKAVRFTQDPEPDHIDVNCVSYPMMSHGNARAVRGWQNMTMQAIRRFDRKLEGESSAEKQRCQCARRRKSSKRYETSS
jgi:hypothetical protein